MRRPTWILLGLCIALACAALGWLSLTTVRLERAEAEGRERAAIEERVRLALWRMDGRMARLVAEESTRGAEQWDAFYVLTDPWFSEVGKATPSELRVASPLLQATADGVRLHFSVAKDGTLSCAEVPPPDQRARAARIGVSAAWLAERAARCRRLSALVDPKTFADVSPAAVAVNDPPREEGTQQLVAQSNLPAQQGVLEFGKRQEQFLQNAMPSFAQQVHRPRAKARAALHVSAMVPLWRSGELFLVRQVSGALEGSTVQGVWLDWPRVQALLKDEVADLLPDASLFPVEDAGTGEVERRLASIPARLVPGAIPALPRAPSAVPWILGAAWGSVLLALVALGFLLAGAVALSERRAAFVSAVTHELRTPLTTFRMYAEMLAGGMVTDEAQRATYYETLEKEANRLAHLVENVLAYARLEKKRSPKASTATTLGAFLPGALERASARAREAGKEVVVELSEELANAAVMVEPSAAEQILFNLIDNACKYAREATDRRLHVTAQAQGAQVAIVVRDHGPGIGKTDAKRLFEPFSKSSERAAESAPGVGLGLALSRRLARAMGGTLRFEGNDGGARFALRLRRAPDR